MPLGAESVGAAPGPCRPPLRRTFPASRRRASTRSRTATSRSCST